MSKQLEFGGDFKPAGFSGDTLVPLNGKMIVLAREAKGFTQKDLAYHLGCNQSRLSKIEAGELTPQESDIQVLVGVLELERDFFFQRETITFPSVSFYRKKLTLPLKVLNQCNAQMNVRRLQIERQIGDRRVGERLLPHLPPEENGGAAEVARKLRQAWQLNSGAVQNLTALIEKTECVIIDQSLPSPKLDGLSLRSAGKNPIIFLNKDLPKSRRRLSLAHELGHVVMHGNPHERIEDEAWDFAAEFLAPTAEIGKQLDGLNLEKLGRLKCEWGISMQAVLHRAKKLGKISESYSRFLWVQIGKCGYRVNEPFEDVIPDEKPTELEKRLTDMA